MLDLSKLNRAKEQEKNYPFCVSWYHTSAKQYHNGNKGKMNFFTDEEKANKFFNKLSERKKNNEPFEQGFITYLQKNF